MTWDTADLRMAKVGYVLHGIALYLMVSHSFACHCIVSYGIAWYCIISYGIAWYCIVGFGVRAVSRKTPIYFIIIKGDEKLKPRSPPACEKACWSWTPAGHLPRISPGGSRQEGSWQPRRQWHRVRPERWPLHYQRVFHRSIQVIFESSWKPILSSCQVWSLNHCRCLPWRTAMAVELPLLWVS